MDPPTSRPANKATTRRINLRFKHGGNQRTDARTIESAMRTINRRIGESAMPRPNLSAVHLRVSPSRGYKLLAGDTGQADRTRSKIFPANCYNYWAEYPMEWIPIHQRLNQSIDEFIDERNANKETGETNEAPLHVFTASPPYRIYWAARAHCLLVRTSLRTPY